MTANAKLIVDRWDTDTHEDFRHSNLGYSRFCRALIDNRLQPGMTLTQTQLSEALDISLSPLRETLVLLEEYGLVEIRQRSGIRIFYPEVSFIRENMQFRSIIEVSAMPVFFRNVREDWITDMRSRHLSLQAKWSAVKHDRDDELEYESQLLDRRFHASIVEALSNDAVQSTHERINQNVHLARKVHQTSFGKEHFVDTIDEHLVVIDGVEAGDLSVAVAALEAHFRTATHRLFIAP